MKTTSFLKLVSFGVSSVLFRRKKAILGTIILTDKCNLSCKHCAVNNITSIVHPYAQIRQEMELLYKQGIRILFFSGGETLLWEDDGKNVRDLVREAKEIGFMIVNLVTNGTLKIDIPEADLILLSMDGGRECHNYIRGKTYDLILEHVRQATAGNICFYMAVNKTNKTDIGIVARLAREEKNVRAVSFNFHTPYPGTEELSLTPEEKQECCDEIIRCMDEGCPVFNLKSAFPYIVHNRFTTPCHQCVVMENGKQSTCGRCISIPGLCDKCGYLFAAEYSLVFHGNIRVAADMMRTYSKYV